jgi:hypothetical protein
MFPFTSALSCQTALFRHGVKWVTMECVGKSNWNKCNVKNEYDKILKKYKWLVNQWHDILDTKKYEKFEWKYLKTSEVIFSLYDKSIRHASFCPNSNIISIKAQLNSTSFTVFIINIYVTHFKLYDFDAQGFNPLAGARNFSHPKNVHMGSRSTQPPIGVPSPGMKWLEHKADNSHHLLQKILN